MLSWCALSKRSTSASLMYSPSLRHSSHVNLDMSICLKFVSVNHCSPQFGQSYLVVISSSPDSTYCLTASTSQLRSLANALIVYRFRLRVFIFSMLYKNILYPTFSALPNRLANSLPMERFPFSISEICRWGMPVSSASCRCVRFSRFR